MDDDNDDDDNQQIESIDGFLTAELKPVSDIAATYRRWKDQREFEWFFKQWLVAPSYPIKLRPGQTYDSRRLEQIISDFGFKRPVVVTRRSPVALPLEQLQVLRKMLANLMNRQTTPTTPTTPVVSVSPVSPVSPLSTVSPVSPRGKCDDSERERVERVLQGVLKDMTALTQERDQLRTLLEQTRKELAQAREVKTIPSVRADPPRVVPVVSKPEVTGLLADIRKGKSLKKSGEGAKKKEEKESSGLAGTLSNALANRRGKLASDDDDEEADKAFDLKSQLVACEMCYSAPVSRCGQCKNVYYCGDKACQIAHWNEGGHKDECQ